MEKGIKGFFQRLFTNKANKQEVGKYAVEQGTKLKAKVEDSIKATATVEKAEDVVADVNTEVNDKTKNAKVTDEKKMNL